MSYRLYYPSNGIEKSVSLHYTDLNIALRNAQFLLEKECKNISPKNLDYFITENRNDEVKIVMCNIPSNYLSHKKYLESILNHPAVQKEEKKEKDKKWVSKLLWTLRQHYLNVKPFNKFNNL